MTDVADHNYSGASAEDMQDLVALSYVYGPDLKSENVVMVSSSYEFTLCNCNNVHIWLINPEGEYFATMTMDTEQIDRACEALQKIKNEILDRRLKGAH